MRSARNSTAYSGTVFFTSLFTRITAWFAHTANGIGGSFARRGIFEEVCVKDANGQTCLTRSQLDAMLAGSAAAQIMEVLPTPRVRGRLLRSAGSVVRTGVLRIRTKQPLPPLMCPNCSPRRNTPPNPQNQAPRTSPS